MADLTSIFGGALNASDLPVNGFPADAARYVEPPELQLKSEIMRAYGVAPDEIILDGRLRRFPLNGKAKDDAGWYVAFDGDIAAGAFGSWREGSEFKWCADVGRDISEQEKQEQQRRIAEAKARREAEAIERQRDAVAKAQADLASAMPAGDTHPYLASHSITANGWLTLQDDRLIVPMYDINTGDLIGAQTITPDGEKKFTYGQRAAGGACAFGKPEKGRPVYIAEAAAKAALVYQVTGCACFCAFSASNMPAVAIGVRSLFGVETSITVIADNDATGTGQRYGQEAAEKAGARLVVMPNIGEDVNDYYRIGGDLVALLLPPKKQSDWLVDADSFADTPVAVEWLIKRNLQANALIMIHGPSGIGKTFLVLDMVMHIATGRQWCDLKTKQGGVVYLAGEGHSGLRSRIASWKKHHGVDKLGRMWLSKGGTDLNKPQGLQDTIEAIESLPEKPSIIVVDTLHRFLNGNENEAQDAKQMIDACDALIRRFGCSVLLVHHTGVSIEAQDRARGSSAWRGNLDIEFSIQPAKDSNTGFVLVQKKNKDSEEVAPRMFDLQKVDLGWIDEDGEPITGAVAVCTDDRNQPEEEKIKAPLSEKAERLLKTLKMAWAKDGGGETTKAGVPVIHEAVVRAFINNRDECRALGLTGTGSGRDKPLRECIDHRLLQALDAEAMTHGNQSYHRAFVITDPISPVFECMQID